MASLILDDPDAACDVVADIIVAACRPGQDSDYLSDPARRQGLAASVYRRCLGILAARERFRWPPDHHIGAGPATRMSANQRAALALTLFGGSSLSHAAAILNQPEATVLRHLTDLLVALDAGRPAATRTALAPALA